MSTQPNDETRPDVDRLHQALHELATELDRTPELDHRSREELRDVMARIRASLERSDAADEGDEPAEPLEFPERFGVEFGANHPQLARIIKQVTDALAGIGI